VIFIFSSIGAATHGIRLPGETLSGAELLFMSLKGPPDDWDSIVLSSPPNLSSKWSKTGKIPQNPFKIRYNFFVLLASVLPRPVDFYGELATEAGPYSRRP
jgi:hypothetical protein